MKPNASGPLPHFLIIGAMKGGTTSLYRELCTHPAVFMPAMKEPDFFVAEKNWNRGLDWYRGLFRPAAADAVCGEASTSYSKCTEFAGVPQRIVSVLPEVRLVYLLRDPVARAQSMYRHNVLMGREREPIGRALRENPAYLDASRYAMQLRRFLDVFDRSRVLVLRSEDLDAQPQPTLQRVTAFLGLPEGHRFAAERHYESSSRRQETAASRALQRLPLLHTIARAVPPELRGAARRLLTRRAPPLAAMPLDVATRRWLVEQLAADLAELQSLLGPEFAGWRLDASAAAEAQGA